MRNAKGNARNATIGDYGGLLDAQVGICREMLTKHGWNCREYGDAEIAIDNIRWAVRYGDRQQEVADIVYSMTYRELSALVRKMMDEARKAEDMAEPDAWLGLIRREAMEKALREYLAKVI